MKKDYQSYILPNGLRVIHKPDISNVSYCGFFVNAGTRDENPDEYGMAHFVEHMLFKGTKKRKYHHIINRMENVGGDLNAYTNKEETVVYTAFLETHFERAFELLTDLVFHSEFPQKEIDKEIDVVIDEIHSYKDSPSELIYDEFENIVFIDSQLGHNILGEPKILKKFTTEHIKAFVRRQYQTENIVFFSSGKTDFKKIIRLAEKYLNNIPEKQMICNRVPAKFSKPQNIEVKKKTSQVHALIGGKAYEIKNNKRRAFHLLNNILGGPGMNSRLNVELREKRGYVYNVESSATTYSDTGLFTIYFGTDKRNTDNCLDIIYKELSKLRNNKLSSSQLAVAKKQLIGQIGVSGDNRENLTLSMGKTYFHYGYIDSQEDIFRKIESVTAEQLIEIANEIFDETGLFRLIYH